MHTVVTKFKSINQSINLFAFLPNTIKNKNKIKIFANT